MKFNKFAVFTMLLVFSSHSFALNTDEWVYETKVGNLKPTAGCKDKEYASKKASTGRRFNKYAKLLCNTKGFGWAIDEVLDKGELVCEACEGEYEGTEKYRCHMKNVKVQCKQVARGW